ncbi:MAG: hypothetical protein JRI26_04265, partial [Deltaproteobacteria bacterium]|nr:hypothetical protein [Deltaproteobacteria bacterium]
GGAASDNVAAIYAAAQKLISYALPQPVKITGFLRHVETNPDGTAVPTALYDIVLNDADGMDICKGALLGRSATLTERVDFDPPIYIDTEISLAITDAGNAKRRKRKERNDNFMDNKDLNYKTFWNALSEADKIRDKILVKRRNDMADKKVDEVKVKVVGKKPSKGKKNVSKGKWVPICRTVVEDFDEDLGKWTGANHLAELQQNSASKMIRTIVINR